MWWRLCSWYINSQVTAWKFCCPFSGCSVFPRQGTYWETNVYAGRIVLHLKPVIWHSSATWFSDSQGGMKICDDEHFVCSPHENTWWWTFCLQSTFFICSDHVWNQSYRSQENLLLVYFLNFPLDNELLILTSWSGENMVQANTILVCIMLSAWIWKIGLLWKGLGLSGKNITLWFFDVSINFQSSSTNNYILSRDVIEL